MTCTALPTLADTYLAQPANDYLANKAVAPEPLFYPTLGTDLTEEGEIFAEFDFTTLFDSVVPDLQTE
jgi:hypothetical protein